jgi:hypothetical protein
MVFKKPYRNRNVVRGFRTEKNEEVGTEGRGEQDRNAHIAIGKRSDHSLFYEQL